MEEPSRFSYYNFPPHWHMCQATKKAWGLSIPPLKMVTLRSKMSSRAFKNPYEVSSKLPQKPKAFFGSRSNLGLSMKVDVTGKSGLVKSQGIAELVLFRRFFGSKGSGLDSRMCTIRYWTRQLVVLWRCFEDFLVHPSRSYSFRNPFNWKKANKKHNRRRRGQDSIRSAIDPTNGKLGFWNTLNRKVESHQSMATRTRRRISTTRNHDSFGKKWRW